MNDTVQEYLVLRSNRNLLREVLLGDRYVIPKQMDELCSGTMLGGDGCGLATTSSVQPPNVKKKP